MRIPRSSMLAAGSVLAVLGATSTAIGAVNTWAAQTVQGGPSATTDAGIGYAIAPLPDGASLITGYFEGSATFGATTLTSDAGIDEVFVAKLNPDGSWAWATQATQPPSDAGGDSARGIAVLPDGSAIVVGSFKGVTTFGTTTITSGNSGAAENIFVAKVNPSGDWVWAVGVADTNGQPDVARAISTLPDGSAIVAGFVRGTATFAPLAPISTTQRDAFVGKIGPTGDWEWVRTAGGSAADEAFGVSALPDGSAVAAGRFTGTATFPGVGTLTSAGGTDAFTAKVGAAGDWQWASRAGGLTDDAAYATSTFADGSAVSSGSFTGTADFGTHSLTTAAGGAFVGRTSPAGEWQWAAKAEDSVAATGVAISATPDGSAVFAGSIQGTAVFGSTTLTTGAARDAVVARISQSGSWLWAQQAGDGAFAEGRGVATFPDRSFAITGDFGSSLTFGANTLTSSGASDVFAARFAQIPDAPTAVTGTAGYERATFNWAAPAINGGAPVTSYTVTVTPGGRTCTATQALSCTVTGLTNGVGYRARVVAVNAAGSGPTSGESPVVTPLPTDFQVVRTSVLKTKLKRSVAIRTSVRVDGPGTIRQAGTRLVRGKRTGACTTKPRTITRATTVLVTCVLNPSARAALAKKSIPVRVVTTFVAKDEAAQTETITIRVPKSPPRRVPVTG